MAKALSSPHAASITQHLQMNPFYQANKLTKKICFHSHARKSLDFNLVEIPHHFSYEEYLKNLKSLSWVSYKVDCLNTLL